MAQDSGSELVDAVDGDAGGETVIEGGGARGKQAPHAQAEQPDAELVDFGASHDPVEHGSDDVLPVGSEDEALEVASGALARSVESEHVVAALIPAAPPQWCISSAGPSKPLCRTIVGRGVSSPSLPAAR